MDEEKQREIGFTNSSFFRNVSIGLNDQNEFMEWFRFHHRHQL